MRIAIYPRKSLYTGKGESIQSQIELCREYCLSHFEAPTFLIYDEDEGYSGTNTRRPAFRRMMTDAANRRFDILCCYRIDRISRNVSDFSRTLEALQEHHISFVSLREQFDTSTPMGRAMMYIASVFAQLERDTLAERVRDNVHFLAQDGRWLGGNTPTGFISARHTIEREGKERTFFTLEEKPEEMALVRDLYARFLELGSLSGLTTYCLTRNLRSKFGRDFTAASLRGILTNPVYCTADEEAYSFFSGNPYNLVAGPFQFDGIHGIKPFNRTEKKPGSSTAPKDISDWLITVGQHIGVISGKRWVEAQLLLDENRSKARKRPRTHNALLSGLVVCRRCGSYMRPKAYGKPLEDGRRRFSYICDLKERSHGTRCSMENAPGLELDDAVIRRLIALIPDRSGFSQSALCGPLQAEGRLEEAHSAADALRASAAQKESRIANLMEVLSYEMASETRARILDQIRTLETSLRQERRDLQALKAEPDSREDGLDFYIGTQKTLAVFSSAFGILTHEERRRQLRGVLGRVVWDGKDIEIHVLGEKRLPE